MLLMPNAEKYKWLLQGKGSQIQINNKTIIEFGSRRIQQTSRQITQTSALIIPHIPLDLIQ